MLRARDRLLYQFSRTWSRPSAGKAAQDATVGSGILDSFASTVWINLDYLSAEDWVEGTHRLVSPQARVGDDPAPLPQVLNKY